MSHVVTWQRGCDGCYGFKQNLLADLKKGTGRCPNCDGWGKIRPDIDLTSPGGRTKRNSISQAPTGVAMHFRVEQDRNPMKSLTLGLKVHVNGSHFRPPGFFH